ncbi:MAG: hypothetical protein JO306_10760 [Gemmatimonadetes bacterium]|nr:hypothetical protein [Gemmatimonadota bacterium]
MAVPPIIHAEHRVVRALRNAGAERRDAAQPLGDLRPIDRRAIERLAASGVVHESGTARYWLDPAAYDVYRARRRRRVYAAMVVVLAAVAVLAALGVVRL